MNVNGGKQSVRELFQDRFVQANAGIHVFERKILVRRMRPAIGQARDQAASVSTPRMVAELRDDRDAAALADERRLFAERLAQRALRRFAHRGMRIGQIPRVRCDRA